MCLWNVVSNLIYIIASVIACTNIMGSTWIEGWVMPELRKMGINCYELFVEDWNELFEEEQCFVTNIFVG